MPCKTRLATAIMARFALRSESESLLTSARVESRRSMYRLPGNPAPTYVPNVQAEFHNNIVCNSGTFLGCQLGEDSSFTLKFNLFYNTDQLAVCDPNRAPLRFVRAPGRRRWRR